MNWKDLSDFIAGVGFPVFVAIFVLLRLEPGIKKQTRCGEQRTAAQDRGQG